MSDRVYNICPRCKRLWFVDESGAVLYRQGPFGYAVTGVCLECKGKVPS